MADKGQARAQAKARRAALDMKEIGAQMARRLLALPQWRRAAAVLAFMPMRDEPDIRPVLRAALSEGKRLYLPRCLPGADGQMEFVPVASPQALKQGRYGIWEPVGAPAPLPPDTLALIPCLAAGTDGTRLGRGGGYYDRFLASYTGERLLLCPAALVTDGLPRDAWDAPFDPAEILTEKGLL